MLAVGKLVMDVCFTLTDLEIYPGRVSSLRKEQKNKKGEEEETLDTSKRLLLLSPINF